MPTVNGYKNKGITFVYHEIQRIHVALGKEQMDKSYYISLAKVFNGEREELVKLVVDHVIATYRGYNMPSEKVFRDARIEVKGSNSQYKPKPIYADEPEQTEEDRIAIRKMSEEWLAKNRKGTKHDR